MPDLKLLRTIFIVVLIFNICYLIKSRFLKFPNVGQIENSTDPDVEYILDHEVVSKEKMTINQDGSYDSSTAQQTILQLLKKVATNENNEFWLGNSSMEFPSVDLNPKDFLPPQEKGQITWQNNHLLYYEPRFTLAVYLDELRHQFETQNPKNLMDKDNLIELPFAWSDWVDLTALNEELSKPVDQRYNCDWLQRFSNKRPKFSDYCVDLVNLTDDELKQMGFTREQLPGYVVKKSPMNKATHKPVMMQGKSFLLTHQENPFSMIFLTPNGTYEAQISPKRERLVDSDLFERFLMRRGIDANHLDENLRISFNPQEEFGKLLSTIQPRPLDPDDDIHGVNKITKNKSDTTITREINLDPSYFHYSQADIDRQIIEFEERLGQIDQKRGENKLESNTDLTPRELNYYQSLKYCNLFSAKDEPTYYKLATLRRSKLNLDTGWHYEWRFFNGAMKFLKDDSWTYPQLEVREQIILDRLLRNWFKFTEAKGIVSWIAHGPLLAWFWNGLMFPYDIDIDLQMPSSELARLALNYNMTIVVEDLNEGYGKYLIDCSTFLHHRNIPGRDNYIDARFIDIDTGSYIDITGVGMNDEKPPYRFHEYVDDRKSKDLPVELYMDRRKHWTTYESINPLRYSMLGGTPVLVPNDIMTMLTYEYRKGVSSYYFQGYYYVPAVRLWIEESQLLPAFKPEKYESPSEEQRRQNIIELIENMNFEDKVRLLMINRHVLIEYYITQRATGLHEREKKLMFDSTMTKLLLNLEGNNEYNHLTAKFELTKPFRKSLFDFEYFGRFNHMPAPNYSKKPEGEKKSE